MNALRSASVGVLLLVFVTGTQGLLVVQGAFWMNRAFIAEHLCENRDRPEMNCEGMCFLQKQMASHDGHGSHGEMQHGDAPADRQPDRGLPTLAGIAGLVATVADVPAPPSRAASELWPGGARACPAGTEADVFRPPRSV